MDFLDAEFGEELVWNDLKPGQDIIMLHEVTALHRGQAFFFGKVESLERMRNCYMLNGYAEEYLNPVKHYTIPTKANPNPYNPDLLPQIIRSYRRGQQGSANRFRTKRLPTSRVWAWNRAFGDGSLREARKRASEKLVRPSLLGDEFKAGAERRKAYAAHRNTLVVAKAQTTQAFETLQLPLSASMDDLKRKKRELLTIYHPDKLLVFMKGGGTQQEFEKRSKLITDSIAEALEYIIRRDATQAVVDSLTQEKAQ